MSAQGRDRFGAAVRHEPVDLGEALLLLAGELDPALAPPAVQQRVRDELDSLAAAVPGEGSGAERLRAVLGDFHGTPRDYAELASSLLPEVVRRRRGLPILLSAVWLEVARRAGIRAYGVGLPGHFVVAVEEPDGSALLVDPWTGGERWQLRPGDEPHVRASDPVEILARVLTNIRVWADPVRYPERLLLRLRAVELALLLPRHPLALRLEAAQLKVAAADFAAGARELDDYAQVVDDVDTAAAEAARAAARSARARLN